jgi:hypothetical protein
MESSGLENGVCLLLENEAGEKLSPPCTGLSKPSRQTIYFFPLQTSWK